MYTAILDEKTIGADLMDRERENINLESCDIARKEASAPDIL